MSCLQKGEKIRIIIYFYWLIIYFIIIHIPAQEINKLYLIKKRQKTRKILRNLQFWSEFATVYAITPVLVRKVEGAWR